MEKQFLLGKFWNPDHVMEALAKFKSAGVKVYDVYTPFPLHGMESLLDIKRTRLAYASFIYGIIGFSVAVLAMSSIFGSFWPMNIGGKPNIPWPSSVPITFELTVLFAAHGIVITFFIVARYWPGKKAVLMDDRQTDDVFVIALDKNKIQDMDEVTRILKDNEAFEISEKEVTV